MTLLAEAGVAGSTPGRSSDAKTARRILLASRTSRAKIPAVSVDGRVRASVIVGVPREVKDNEYRVAATPEGVRELSPPRPPGPGRDRRRGGLLHPRRAVRPRGRRDPATRPGRSGTAADLVLKVKEPVASEYDLLREDQILFTYLHLAASADLTRALLERKVAAVAYETVQARRRVAAAAGPDERGGRPHGAPRRGADCWNGEHGGRGILMGGVSGVARPRRCW